MAATQVKCGECDEWFDSRYDACPNGHPRPEYNHALKKANDAARLNGALGGQMREVQVEAGITRSLPTGNLGGRAGPSQLYPGRPARDLAEAIKAQLRE